MATGITGDEQIRCIGIDISSYYNNPNWPQDEKVSRVVSDLRRKTERPRRSTCYGRWRVSYTNVIENAKLSKKVNEAIKIFNDSHLKRWSEKKKDDEHYIEFTDQCEYMYSFETFNKLSYCGGKQEISICKGDEVGDILHKMGHATGFNYAGMYVKASSLQSKQEKDTKAAMLSEQKKDTKAAMLSEQEKDKIAMLRKLEKDTTAMLSKLEKDTTAMPIILVNDENMLKRPKARDIIILGSPIKGSCTVDGFHEAIRIIGPGLTRNKSPFFISDFYCQCSTCWGDADFPVCFYCAIMHHGCADHTIQLKESAHGVLSSYGCICCISGHLLKCTRHIPGDRPSQPYYSCSCTAGGRFCFPCKNKCHNDPEKRHQIREAHEVIRRCSHNCNFEIPLFSIDEVMAARFALFRVS